MRSPSCWKKAKRTKRKQRGLKTLTPSGHGYRQSELLSEAVFRWGQVLRSGWHGGWLGSARLGSPSRHHSGLPSRDTTTFPPSFSASVVRSWMSSSPFTCHSCLIPEETHLKSLRVQGFIWETDDQSHGMNAPVTSDPSISRNLHKLKLTNKLIHNRLRLILQLRRADTASG